MSAMDAESKELLREWLVRSLEPVCDADPEVLSKYVLALIQNDPKKEGLRETCVSKLEEFLGDETHPFVTRLFSALETEAYRKDAKPSHNDSGRGHGQREERHHQDDSSRRRVRSDDEDADEQGRYGKQRRREDDGGRNYSPRRGGEREGRRGADGYGGRDGGRGGRGRDWDRERRGGPGSGPGGVFPPHGDRRRDFPPEWGMPPPGMWPPHHPYPPPRGAGFAPPHHPMGEFDPNSYNPEMQHMMMGGRGGGPMGGPYYPPYGGRGGRGGRGNFHGGRGGSPLTKDGEQLPFGADAGGAKTTLRVSNVDPKYVNMTKLSLHFSKFGNVVNVQMRPQHKCAYVQYASEEEAKKAFHSPYPVCNNRFIEVKWARYDAKDPHGAPSEETQENKTDGGAENKSPTGEASSADAGEAEAANGKGGAETADEKNMTPEELQAAALEKGRKVLEEKRELLEKQKQLMKQKEELLKRQLAQQKELLERMSQNPAIVSASDKRELLNKITTLSEELKALQPRRDSGDQYAKLSGLKAELSALEAAAGGGAFIGGRGRGRGAGAGAGAGGRWGAPQTGAGRGFYRGGQGGRGGRGGRNYSNTLDNRTTIVKVENLPEEARDPSVLEQHFGAFGGIERVVVDESAPERGFIKFQDRYAGQNALMRGTVFGQSRLQLSWVEAQDAPAEMAPPTPVAGSGGDDGGNGEASFSNETAEVSASA